MTDTQRNDLGVWFIMLVVIAAILVSDLAKQHVKADAAVGAGACAIVLLAVARVRWDFKGKWCFWVALCVGSALQLPLIFLMPWSDRYIAGIGVMAFVIPGFLMALGCVLLRRESLRSAQAPNNGMTKTPQQCAR